MVRFLALLWAALSIVSCGAARRPADGLEIPDPRGGADDETVQRGSEEPDLARKEFELAEYLDYLESDAGRPVRATCRFTEGMISVPNRERSDAYLNLETERWKALLRVRRTDGAEGAVSGYLCGSASSGAVRFLAGSFVPDFAFGLAFGGSGGSSLSSGAFPFRSPRRIAGATSFFLQTLHGAAAEFRHRNVYASIFEGRPVTFGPNGPEKGECRVSGARIEARRNGLEIGFSGSTGICASGRDICAIDGRWRSDRLNAGIELGLAGPGEPSLLSGFSYRVPKTRGALFLYAVSPGGAGFFGSVNGRTPGRNSSLCGAAAVAEREVLRRVRARASIDRYERADGFHETVRQTTRFEIERRGKRSHLRLTWIDAGDERRDLVPYPPAGEIGLESSRSLCFLSEWRVDRKRNIGLALKRVEGTDELGWLAAPVFRADLFSAHVRVTASLAAYRAAYGHPACYFYEPSLRGSYPIRFVSRDTEMSAILIGIFINRIEVFVHAALERNGVPELSLQASAGL
jgi:hypothetical protein